MDHVEQKALNLLETFNLDVFPIDVKKLASELELEIIEEKFEDNIAGLLYYKNCKGYIGINKRHVTNRQRFTLAHEIGHHALLHHVSDNDIHVDRKSFIFRRTDNSDGNEIHEREANKFAASLLMPSSLLKKYIRQNNIDLNDDLDIYELSKKLEVSEQALTYRLLNLGLILYR